VYSIEELAIDFRKLGIRAGDQSCCTLRCARFGVVAGGPDAIHLALKSALTSEGTLIMYASCPRCYDELGRGNLTVEQEREIREKLPVFDLLTARSARDNGILVGTAQAFRRAHKRPRRDLDNNRLCPLMFALETDQSVGCNSAGMNHFPRSASNVCKNSSAAT